MPENQPLRPGDLAPEFELLNQDKVKVRLSAYRGRRVVLLFYPMDFSPTCTAEHCTFGPSVDQFIPDAGAVVFGVSCDSPYCHAAFRAQYAIPYDLLSDTSRRMVKAYGMWAGEEPYNCSKRGTVVIDEDGRISFWQETPTRTARSLEDLRKAVAIQTAESQRANEFGQAI